MTIRDDLIVSYEIGDTVIVREDINEDTNVPFSFGEGMCEYRGHTFTVTDKERTRSFPIISFPIIQEMLDNFGIPWERDDSIQVTKYTLNNDTWYSWNIFMFDNIMPIRRNLIDPEELDMLYGGTFI